MSGSRLGDYHRSKQNPAVLDQLITSPTPQNLYKSSPAIQPSSERFNIFSLPQNTTTGFSPLSRRIQTPFRLSPFQTTRRSASPFGTGLVSMAVRGRLRESQTSGVSPVMVHLPSTSLSVSRGSERDGLQSSEEAPVNPCNREVVISALKAKRKRWACQVANDDPNGDNVVENAESQPAAKRSRYGEKLFRITKLFVFCF